MASPFPYITPPLDQIVPYDSQCDPALVAPSWREMGLAVARIMQPHSLSSSVLLPYMMPLVETNLLMFQACVKGHQGIHYSVESITREEKTSGLTEFTIDRRLFQMVISPCLWTENCLTGPWLKCSCARHAGLQYKRACQRVHHDCERKHLWHLGHLACISMPTQEMLGVYRAC